MSPPTQTSTDDGELTHRQILTILGGLMMGMFLGALDQTIVSTSIRTIADDLSGLSVQAWVTTAYLVTSTISTPIYGKLGDLYGRKKLFMFAITVFIVGSALCAFATSMYMLASFRAVQGLGAGGLFSLVLAILGDIVPPRQRAKYMGYFMATFGTSSVLGPVIGGFFAAQDSLLFVSGWRWVFLVNVPLGLAALVVVSRTLRLHHEAREARIDWWGASLLVVGVMPLLIVAEQGREWGWSSTASLSCLVVGVVGVLGFVEAERRMGADALIPLRLFRIRAAAVTIAAGVIIGMAMFGGLMVLPLYMQIVQGATPMESGFLMLPMVVGLMAGSAVSGQVTSRTGAVRIFPRIGTLLVATGLFLLATIDADSPLSLVMAYMLVLGLGLGNCMQPLTLIIQNAVPPREIGVATSSATFFRQMGGTLGVAAFLSVLFATAGPNIATAIEGETQTSAFQQVATDPRVRADPVNRQVLESLAGERSGEDTGVVASILDDSSILERMDPALAHPFRAGFSESMSAVFLYAALISLLAFAITLLLPPVELRSQSARVAALAEARALAPTAPAAGSPSG